MKRLIVLSVSTVTLLVLATGVHAQDLLVPAGTLLQCTLNEPGTNGGTAISPFLIYTHRSAL